MATAYETEYGTEYKRRSRPKRRRRRGRGFLRLLLLAVLVLAAYKLTDGFDFLRNVSSAPMENIETNFAIDLGDLEAKLAALGGAYVPGDADVAKLRDIAAENHKYADKIDFLLEHIGAYSREAVNTVIMSPEKLDFVLLSPLADSMGVGGAAITAKRGEVPYLVQYDSRWAFHEYGSSCMGYTACGPTCLSMAAIGLTGNAEYTPAYISDFSEANGYYVDGTGTAWSLFTDGAAELGLNGRAIGTDKRSMNAALSDGAVLIASVSAGDFTMGGHLIVIHAGDFRGYRVYDPSSIVRSDRLWSYDKLSPQIAQLWAISA
ncbi:MAG: C39 family peptidase [Oscillospiraceae bacterium]